MRVREGRLEGISGVRGDGLVDLVCLRCWGGDGEGAGVK